MSTIEQLQEKHFQICWRGFSEKYQEGGDTLQLSDDDKKKLVDNFREAAIAQGIDPDKKGFPDRLIENSDAFARAWGGIRPECVILAFRKFCTEVSELETELDITLGDYMGYLGSKQACVDILPSFLIAPFMAGEFFGIPLQDWILTNGSKFLEDGDSIAAFCLDKKIFQPTKTIRQTDDLKIIRGTSLGEDVVIYAKRCATLEKGYDMLVRIPKGSSPRLKFGRVCGMPSENPTTFYSVAMFESWNGGILADNTADRICKMAGQIVPSLLKVITRALNVQHMNVRPENIVYWVAEDDPDTITRAGLIGWEDSITNDQQAAEAVQSGFFRERYNQLFEYTTQQMSLMGYNPDKTIASILYQRKTIYDNSHGDKSYGQIMVLDIDLIYPAYLLACGVARGQSRSDDLETLFRARDEELSKSDEKATQYLEQAIAMEGKLEKLRSALSETVESLTEAKEKAESCEANNDQLSRILQRLSSSQKSRSSSGAPPGDKADASAICDAQLREQKTLINSLRQRLTDCAKKAGTATTDIPSDRQGSLIALRSQLKEEKEIRQILENENAQLRSDYEDIQSRWANLETGLLTNFKAWDDWANSNASEEAELINMRVRDKDFGTLSCVTSTMQQLSKTNRNYEQYFDRFQRWRDWANQNNPEEAELIRRRFQGEFD